MFNGSGKGKNLLLFHCRKTLHSRTKENRLVIQIEKALWRKVRPLFSRKKRKCSCIRGRILSTRNKNHSKSMCVPWPLSVKQEAKITFAQWKCRTFQRIIYPAEEKTYGNKQHFGIKSCQPTTPFYCYKYPKIGVIPVGDRSAADLFVLVFEASRSGEVMIVSVPSAFQVRSLQRLVKLQTELARRRACFKSSYRRSTTFCKINNEVHAPFHSVFRRSKIPLISC